MNHAEIDFFLEALIKDSKDLDNPVFAETHITSRYYNWLDAAPAELVPELADGVILALAQIMSIRASAMLEEAFNANGYGGYMPVNPDPVPEKIIREAESHVFFYLRLQRRLAGLVVRGSPNRHIACHVHLPESALIDTPDRGKPAPRSFHEEYECRRRHNIHHKSETIVTRPERAKYDFLSHATPERLEESADIIVLATAARMAVRASLRLEKTWRGMHVCFAGERLKSPPLPDVIAERNRCVEYYLGIREELTDTAQMIHINNCSSGAYS